MKIDMQELDYKFLQDLVYRLKTQDRKGTAKPVIYTIQTDEIQFVPDGFADNLVYVWYDNGDVLEFYDIEDLREHLLIDYCDDESIYNLDADKVKSCKDYELVDYCVENDIGIETYNYIIKHKYQGAFLTRDACERHIKANNYHYKNPKIYVTCGWRNPELRRLLEILNKYVDTTLIKE